MPFNFPEINLTPLLPAIVPAVTAMIIMLADALLPGKHKSWLSLVALAGLVVAVFFAVNLFDLNASAFNSSIVADNFALGISVVILIAAFLTILLSMDYLTARNLDFGEYLALLLGAVSGMILMALANDLIVIFLGLELLSLPLYVLSAFWRTNNASLEAGMKYFLLGAFSSAFFLYGIAFLYGATGTTNLTAMNTLLTTPYSDPFFNLGGALPLFILGSGLLLIGFGFKLGVVPFQWWIPDVYEGAPTPVTAFMSVTTKAAAFAAFFRAFVIAVPQDAVAWQFNLAIIAVLTMTVGNVAALVQTNIKRMLAYSSIAHAGYILIALVVGGDAGRLAAMFYFAAYALMNLAAFGAVIALGDGTRERLTFADLSGAAQQKAWAAAALAIALLSLAGFPPFAGFVAKFFVFGAAVNAGLVWLAVIGVLNSLVSVYYYLGPIVRMYMNPPTEGWAGTSARTPILLAVAVVFAVAITIALGLFPSEVIQFAQASMQK
ncbi:MAG TPA: NADH-quinone oxidoreductase subunit N [Anaerolineae bacterium]|nr:NADH-quinone oxidoreductase subunit N [Anaerolineae bacterium]